MKVSYGGVYSNTVGIAAFTKVHRPILPGTRDRLVAVMGRDGALDYGSDAEPKYITCEFYLHGATVETYRGYVRSIAEWLSVGLAQLIFEDEPSVYYMARPVGSVEDEQTLLLGRGKITFVVPSGYAEAVTTVTATAFPAENAGTLPCHGIVTVTMAQAADDIKITLAETGEYILLIKDAVRWPVSLEIGDEIVIDTDKRLVTVQANDARAGVSYLSDWFKIPTGDFSITTNKLADVEVTYRELYR